MAFRTFLKTLGSNAPRVDTVLDTTTVRPGARLGATVTVQGGGVDVHIERLTLELVTRVEDKESTETGWTDPGVVASQSTDSFDLPAGETLRFRLDVDVPWEMPITHVHGRPLRGARAAVRTCLDVDRAVDRGDFDEIAVHALPAQDMIVEAFGALGFRLEEAEVKKGQVIGGKNQTSPFWQELEYYFPADYGLPHGTQLEVATIARADSLDLITGPHGPYPFAYADMNLNDLTKWLDSHCRSLWHQNR
ncbi:sporulation protein [Thermomonospora cellulosilytica]|uniref:Sporulation-control protein n=1 Tax=Thermomonospora cellulosilytica TaxID=1411118 RepID=A0A7W3N3H1_9ACTN|nr:sporulation protein [Thermomonospora cellulosilytica]MBA9006835.1 sporulation-control protein [Thermomonospora cellulosilytica]